MTEKLIVYVGPLLRRVSTQSVVMTWATNQPIDTQIEFSASQPLPAFRQPLADRLLSLKAGNGLYLYFLTIEFTAPLPSEQPIYYDLRLNNLGWQDWAADLCYAGHHLPFFTLQPSIQRLLHGSCRKPHYPSGDGLVRVDAMLATKPVDDWPSLLMLSGDQVYVDDVAGPLLYAIHQLNAHLQLNDEALPCAQVASAQTLHQAKPYYYRREEVLPADPQSQKMRAKIFSGVRKPIFTTDTAHNHLISLGECIGMYLLAWSPAGWSQLDEHFWQTPPDSLRPNELNTFLEQQHPIKEFVKGLPAVRRVLAHLPTAMIFDDHDITDDWNLSAAWEQTAYQHPFSNRIIGNALIGYLLFQGWGNAPERFPISLFDQVQAVLDQPGLANHDELIHKLNRFHQWSYRWPTNPPLVVLDTRTQRWRSESKLTKPSGLMDWEALSDLQQDLLGLEAVILVSPAPIFGVKFIEVVQKIFTWLGQPLLVDAENWMAHPGAAHTLINLFRHPKTPKHFIILSGDVHYSFVYRIELRGKMPGSDLWQITSSGIKNEFPPRLLGVLDRFNRWLYAPKSPLNWFTRRRHLRVIPHKPQSAEAGERLLNAAGIGLVVLHADGSPKQITQLCADQTQHANQAISFELNH